MGRAFSAVAELKKRIDLAKKARKKIYEYISELNHKHSHALILSEEYHKKLREKIDGKSLNDWINYYDSYIKDCENLIQERNKDSIKKKSFSILIVLGFFLVFSLFYFQPSFIGFSVSENVQEYSQEINLNFSESGEYNFVLEEIGNLDYVLASGYFNNSGKVKIYLENYLIFNSENYDYENLSLEENKSEALLSGKSPSHDRELLNSSLVYFEKICEETCDLSFVELNKSEYVLRIEIENSSLFLENIDYGILFSQISEEGSILEESLESINEIKLNEPVVWKKRIVLKETGKLKINLPKGAKQIKVKKLENNQEKDAKYSVREDSVGSVSRITGFVTSDVSKNKIVEVDDSSLEYIIEYETPAAYSVEEELKRGKRVKIVGPEEIHYENVLAFTNLSEDLGILNSEKVKIYWIEEEIYLDAERILDLDNNGIYDYLEWNVPHLSNQTFEIIVITKAEYLDSGRNFISDIYDSVKELDEVWSPEILDGEYIRVIFEKNLTSNRDITIYPRVVSKTPRIEVYEINGNEIIAEFDLIKSNEHNKIYLSGLEGEQDSFDLRVVGGSVEFDYIFDPPVEIKWADSHLSGSVTTPANALGETDNSWTEDTGNTDWTSRFSMSNPSGSLTGTQIINVLARETANGNGNPTMTITLYENGASVSTLATDQGVSTTSAATNVSGTFDSSSITNADDVEIEVAVTGHGGGPNADTIQIDSIKWDVSYNILDEISPYFTLIPENASLWYGNESLGVNFDAEDETEFGSFSVNDTNLFSINSTGWLSNATSFGVGNYAVNVTINDSSGNINWTIYSVEVNKSIFSCGVLFNETSPIDYGNSFNVWSDCDSSFTLYRNGTEILNNSEQSLAAGAYNFSVQRTDTINYSNTYDEAEFQISKIQSWVNLSLNDSASNITIEQGTEIPLNCSTLSGDSEAYVSIYQEGVLINNETSPIGNFTTFNTVQVENITCFYSASENYSSNFTTWFVNVTEVSESEPEIIQVWNSTMTDVSSGPDEGPLATYVAINFSVSDSNGFENLKDDSALINFSKAGEETREASCSRVTDESSGNYANYTCNVTMWWFDGAGTWDIHAYIEDNGGLSANNNSQSFYLGLTTGFISSSSELSWPEIDPGSINQEAFESFVLNNTGNDVVDIEINATNLYGEENSSQALWAANFSAHTSAGCEGTAMVEQTFTQVSGASLAIGNYSLGDGTGQEEIFFCLEAVNPNLDSQSYSTQEAGAWIIRIFMVMLASARKKKKKEDKKNKRKLDKKNKLISALILLKKDLDEFYSKEKKKILDSLIKQISLENKVSKKEVLSLISEDKEIKIPLEIFSKNIGALESVSKYFKENLNMKYSEIGKILGRDEKTIWGSYHKSLDKVKSIFKIKSKEFISLSDLPLDKLTILEAIIVYLRENGKRYNEIAELLNRDQRNIWSIYFRAKKKLM